MYKIKTAKEKKWRAQKDLTLKTLHFLAPVPSKPTLSGSLIFKAQTSPPSLGCSVERLHVGAATAWVAGTCDVPASAMRRVTVTDRKLPAVGTARSDHRQPSSTSPATKSVKRGARELDPEAGPREAAASFSLGLQGSRRWPALLPLCALESETRGLEGLNQPELGGRRGPGATLLPARPVGAATSSSSSGRAGRPGAGAPMEAVFTGGRGAHMGGGAGSHLRGRPVVSDTPSGRGRWERGLPSAPQAPAPTARRARVGGAAGEAESPPAAARAGRQGEGRDRDF